MKVTRLAGIDVGARNLKIEIETARDQRCPVEFANTPAGHRRLIRRLTQGGRRARVALEASGIYTRALQTRNRFEGFQAAFCS